MAQQISKLTQARAKIKIPGYFYLCKLYKIILNFSSCCNKAVKLEQLRRNKTVITRYNPRLHHTPICCKTPPNRHIITTDKVFPKHWCTMVWNLTAVSCYCNSHVSCLMSNNLNPRKTTTLRFSGDRKQSSNVSGKVIYKSLRWRIQ
jgi:hypothetical protein